MISLTKCCDIALTKNHEFWPKTVLSEYQMLFKVPDCNLSTWEPRTEPLFRLNSTHSHQSEGTQPHSVNGWSRKHQFVKRCLTITNDCLSHVLCWKIHRFERELLSRGILKISGVLRCMLHRFYLINEDDCLNLNLTESILKTTGHLIYWLPYWWGPHWPLSTGTLKLQLIAQSKEHKLSKR